MNKYMALSATQDELTVAICGAVTQLTQMKKAGALLHTALALIEDGQSEEEVEKCLDIYLKTPDLPKEDVMKALSARGRGKRLPLAKAQQGYLDSLQCCIELKSTQDVQPARGSQLGCEKAIDPSWQRVPPEIWAQIAAHMPRYHLRNWLFVSRFHRHTASRHIFHTIDLYFGDDEKNCMRTIDIFDRAKNDPVFASQVKSLRLHQGYKRDVSNLMLRISIVSLPAFKALQNFEWVGYQDSPMPRDLVQALSTTHKHLYGLGLIGVEFSAIGVSAFDKLRKFTLRVDGHVDVGEVRVVLDQNQCTLKHLTLCGFVYPTTSWDLAFESVTINNLTHLHLVDVFISKFVLMRIASAHNLKSLTLPALHVNLDAAAVFASDRIIDGSHTLLPHLEAFRLFVTPSEHNYRTQQSLSPSVLHFLRKRDKLRRLDLGGCPGDIVRDILPDLRNLKVLAVHIGCLPQEEIMSLIESMPRQMVAIRVIDNLPGRPLDHYAHCLTRFKRLAFLNFQLLHADHYLDDCEPLLNMASTIPSLDFLVWRDNPSVVVRPADADPVLEPLTTTWCFGYGGGIDFGSDDATWLGQKDVPWGF